MERLKQRFKQRLNQRFKIPINCPEVPSEFLHALLKHHAIGLDLINPKKNRRTNVVGNNDLILFIQFHYNYFSNSSQTMNEYFESEIIHVRVNQNKGLIHQTEINSTPLFLAKHAKNENFLYGDFSVSAKHPIKMPLHLIVRMGQFDFFADTLDFVNCPRGIALVKVENQIAFTDGETTSLDGCEFFVGKNGNDFFWIPDEKIIQRRYYCSKFPGQCEVYFNTKYDCDRHEKICRTDTLIKSKQVNLYTILYI